MTPRKFTIVGSLGVLAGLGREAFSIDLTTIPADAVRVAIRGDNGSGKSTLLNLAFTPWREPSTLRGPIYSYFGPTGSRELEWSHDGEIYRSTITYKQTAKTKSTKAVLHILRGEEWSTFTAPDNTISDGKASTYDHCLESVLGPQDLYYLSAFRGQNARMLAEHDDPKSLMRSLLGLDRYEALEKAAGEVHRAIVRIRDIHRAPMDEFDNIDSDIEGMKTLIENMEAESSGLDDTLLAMQGESADLDAKLREAADSDLIDEQIRGRRQGLSASLREVESTLAARQASHSAHLKRERERVVDARQRTYNKLQAIESDRKDLDAQVQRLELLLQREEEVREACWSLPGMEEALDDAKEQLKLACEASAALDEELQTYNQLQADRLRAKGDVQYLSAMVESAEKRAGFLSVVPCQGAGKYASCPALVDANEACKGLEEAKGKLHAADARRLELETEIAGYDDIRAREEAATDLEKEANRLVQKISSDLGRTKEVAAKKEGIDQAAVSLKEARGRYEVLGTRASEIQQEQASFEEQVTKDAVEKSDEMEEEKRVASDRIATIREQLAATPEVGDMTHKESIEAEIRAFNVRHANATSRRDYLSAKIAAGRAEIEALDDKKEEMKEKQGKVDAINGEIADWSLLRSALKGVSDLIIEDAGPTIAQITNELLTHAYGPRFSVRIVTQRQQANGKLVECFDISVIDSESGLESSILQKSGGECVWLDKALVDAVALYHQQVSGISYETVMSDEAEDGLTQERKESFYRMDRAMLGRGGYGRSYSVSHNPGAWAMADHVINLDDYKVER